MSDYVIMRALNPRMLIKQIEFGYILRNLAKIDHRIESNINQIARIFNTNKNLLSDEVIREYYYYLGLYVDQINDNNKDMKRLYQIIANSGEKEY